MIRDIEDYFARGCGRCPRFDGPDCATRHWAAGLAELRRICLDMGLVETLKWGHPCYMAGGRNVAILGAFRQDLRLSFFDAALLEDTHGLLQKQGPNTAHPDMLRFTDNAEVRAMEPQVRAYLQQAIAHAQAGRRAPRATQAIELPPELAEALQADGELAQAFQALTPGRQRSYVIWLNAARQPATRRTRIERARPAILAGKGAQER